MSSSQNDLLFFISFHGEFLCVMIFETLLFLNFGKQKKMGKQQDL